MLCSQVPIETRRRIKARGTSGSVKICCFYFSVCPCTTCIDLKMFRESEMTCNGLILQRSLPLYTASSPSKLSIPKKVIYDIILGRVFDISSLISLYIFLSSATGWILGLSLRCSSNDLELYNLYQSWYHIYNPITGQYIVVQKAMIDDDVDWETGALILAQKSNQLKFVFHSKRMALCGPVEAYIQTIGTNTWKNLGELPHYSGQGHPTSS